MPEAQSKSSFVNPIWVLLTGVLAFFAAGGPKSSSDKPSPPPEVVKKDTTDEGTTNRAAGKGGILQTLREQFIGTKEAATGEDDPQAPFFQTLRDWLLIPEEAKPEEVYCTIACYDHRILLATVPDPVDSKLGHVFDQVIAAIQGAIGDAKYAFDRSFLPWEYDKKRMKANKTSARPFRESVPGLLLFRKPPSDDDDKNELCIVLLVGENPTSGIDKIPFAQSLQIMKAVAKKDQGTFKIVGPCFTGSAFSLRVALQQAVNDYPDWHFDLIGAANGIDKEAFLKGLNVHPCTVGSLVGSLSSFSASTAGYSASPLAAAALFTWDDRVRYAATQVHANQITDALLYFLCRQNQTTSKDDCFSSTPDKVALLVEASTGFGRSISSSISRSGQKKASGSGQGKGSVTVMRFPLHIARLKAAYDKERRQEDEKLGLPTDGIVVALPEDQAGTQADIIPSQDQATTALVNDKILTDLLTTVKREKIRYVGIVATDVWDQIFLGCYVRDHCPGVQLFFVDADTLLSHKEYSHYLKGSLIGTTYPLIPENRSWTKAAEGRREVAFGSSTAQAYYNATLAQLQQAKRMVEYGPPQFVGMPTLPNRSRPPIWITMIGQSGEFLPLQFFTNYPRDKDVPDDYVYDPCGCGPALPTQVRLAIPGLGFALMLGALWCGICGWVLYRFAYRYSPWLVWPLSPNPRSLTWEQWFYQSACLMALFVLLYPLVTSSRLAVTYASEEKNHLRVARLHDLITVLFAVVIGFFVWVLLVRLCPFVRCYSNGWSHWLSGIQTRWSRTAERMPLSQLVQFPTFHVAILGVGWLAWPRIELQSTELWKQLEDPQTFLNLESNSWNALYLERAFRFASGVSPLLPLALMSVTFFLGGVFQLRATLLIDSCSVRRPCPAPRGATQRPALEIFLRLFRKRLRRRRWPTRAECLRLFSVLFRRSPQRVTDRPRSAFQEKLSLFRRVAVLDRELTSELRSIAAFVAAHWFSFLLVLAATGILWLRLSNRLLPLVEGRFWDQLFLLGFVAASGLILFNLVRFLCLWSKVRKLLHEWSLIPIMRAFDRLPFRVSSIFGGYLFTQRPHQSQLRVPIQQARLLAAEMGKLQARVLSGEIAPLCDGANVEADLLSEARNLRTDLENLIQESEQQPNSPEDELSQPMRDRLSWIARRCLRILPWFWGRRSVDDAFGRESAAAPEATSTAERSDPFAGWVQAAEALVATQTVIYLSQFFIQLRNLVKSLTICSCLLLLSATSYPFQPERFVLFMLMGIIAAVLGSILMVLVQLNYDELVSRITRTTPNRFTLDSGFLSSFFLYVVPTLTIVVMQFSGVFRFLLEPVLRAAESVLK